MALKRALTKSEIAQIAVPPTILAAYFILATIYVEPRTPAGDALSAPWMEYTVNAVLVLWLVLVLGIIRRHRRAPA